MTPYNDNNTTKTTDHDNSSNGYANSCNQTSEMPSLASTLILDSMLKGLSLLTIKEVYSSMSEQAEKLRLTYTGYLYELVQSETEQRHQKNVLHLLRLAKLPRNKLLLDFDISRIPGLHPGLVKTLSEGAFIDRCENLLFFGNPGII